MGTICDVMILGPLPANIVEDSMKFSSVKIVNLLSKSNFVFAIMIIISSENINLKTIFY